MSRVIRSTKEDKDAIIMKSLIDLNNSQDCNSRYIKPIKIN